MSLTLQKHERVFIKCYVIASLLPVFAGLNLLTEKFIRKIKKLPLFVYRVPVLTVLLSAITPGIKTPRSSDAWAPKLSGI